MIRRSTQLIVETAGIAEITEITSSNLQIRRRRDSSIALPMQRSGVRSIVPPDTIQKSVKLFWITKRCHHQQHWWNKNPDEASIAELILTTRIRWGKSM
jgi:hypothetical protein